MAFDSSRTRIDQFFASRKRKPISPGLKSGKDARGKVETSPNEKGNLDNFLVNSPENDTRSQAQRGLLGRHDSLVKRSLALEIDVVSRSYNTEALATTAEMHMPHCEVVEMARKETSQGSSNVADATGKATGKDDPVLVDCGENSELEQFATDFLSLYCSGLKSTATSPLKPKMNDHKRYGRPLLVDGEDNSSKKRHCISHDLRLDGETAYSIEKKTEDMQSAAVVESGESIFCATGKVAVVNDPVHLQGSLRKCNMVTKSTLNTDEFQTPGSMVAKAGVCAIPKSSSRSRGSSLFSPGEAFWNEAILVADGLFGDADNPDAQVTEDIINGCNKSREVLSKDGGRGQQMGHGDSLELVRMRSKNSVKEVPPLPVKHLDFMFEDKNLDISTPCHAAVNTSKCRDGELSECCSANVKGPQTADIASHHSNDQINEGMHEAEVITSVHRVDTREVNLSNQDPDNITSRPPISEIMNSMVNIKYDQAVTPSSLMPFIDQLDLINWLPADVCSIYKRKGMSRLYPWQVDCLQVDGVLQRRNLVYCASTSAGKSFVAEILMLRRIMTTGKIALLVLPYVSICSEKAEHLEGLLEPLGKNVLSYYRNQGGGTLPKDTSVAVCTIEKANSLVNKLLEEGRLSEIGIIVIDELHVVGDQRRGYLLELLLTNFVMPLVKEILNPVVEKAQVQAVRENQHAAYKWLG